MSHDDLTLEGGEANPGDLDSEPMGTSKIPPSDPTDSRSTAVWRQWLSSMASDAEAALAAAIAYREMDSTGRDNWLSSLQLDAPAVDVPPIALYAPLLAVEQDPERRERLLSSLGEQFDGTLARSEKRAFLGGTEDGTKVYVLATPLYLDFVQVLACGVREGEFTWVRHDPIADPKAVPLAGDSLLGAKLEPTPIKGVLDELAQAVLSHQRMGKALPEALGVLGDLLGPLGP